MLLNFSSELSFLCINMVHQFWGRGLFCKPAKLVISVSEFQLFCAVLE